MLARIYPTEHNCTLFVCCLQALELLCPAVIMLLIGAIKNIITPVINEAVMPSSDTPVPTYGSLQNVTTTFPNVLCYDNNMFMR